MQSKRLLLESEAMTQAFAQWLATELYQRFESGKRGFRLYLNGTLGAGKSTLSRYFLRHLGVKGAIKSPTYTLVEPYRVGEMELLHIDLYRLGSAEEIYDLGFLEEESAIWLIEWPEKGVGVLPKGDLILTLERKDSHLSLTIQGESLAGERVVERIDEQLFLPKEVCAVEESP